MARKSKWFVVAGIASVALPAVAVEVRHADGVEIISGRPAQASALPSEAASRIGGSVSGPVVLPAPGRETTGRNDALDDASAPAGAASGSVTRERLRAAEAVLHDQIGAYNQALLDGAGDAVLKPLETAISRTLEHIEALLRIARQPES